MASKLGRTEVEGRLLMEVGRHQRMATGRLWPEQKSLAFVVEEIYKWAEWRVVWI